MCEFESHQPTYVLRRFSNPPSVRADPAGGLHELPAGAGPTDAASQVPDPRPRHSADLPLALPW